MTLAGCRPAAGLALPPQLGTLVKQYGLPAAGIIALAATAVVLGPKIKKKLAPPVRFNAAFAIYV